MKIMVDGKLVCIAGNAANFLTRFRGLMMKKKLYPFTGLFLKNCSCIHTCFMRFPIDVIYLDQEYKVLDSETIEPWKRGKMIKGAKHVLEVSVGEKKYYPIGTTLELKA